MIDGRLVGEGYDDRNQSPVPDGGEGTASRPTKDWDRVMTDGIRALINPASGAIYPVNPKYDEIAGLTCYPDVASIPGAIDLAVVAIPARDVAAAIADLGEKGARAAVVFSAGFAEMGEAGAALEKAVVEVARGHGVRLCGPNTLGLINGFTGATATFSQYAKGPIAAGPVAFITQSGAFGTAIAALARLRGMGLGYVVNTGNEADVTLVDVMGEILADKRIRVCTAYVEGLRDGPEFLELAGMALERGQPIIVLKVGRGDAGARAAASHTGALAGEDRVFDGVARQKGIIRARNEEQMLDLAEAFAACPLPAGPGVGIVSQSGGAGVMMADRAEELGLTVPVVGEATRAALAKVLPAFGTATNPVDMTGQFIAEPAILRDGVRVLLADPDIHIAIVWLELMEDYAEQMLAIFRDIRDSVDKPVIISWVAASDEALKGLRDMGICVLRGGEPAIDAAAALVGYAEARRRGGAPAGPTKAPDLPAKAGPVPTLQAGEILHRAGVRLVESALAGSAGEAFEAAEKIGYPVALKIESPDILHKTEAGGVRLGLGDRDAVEAAFAEITASARTYRPDAAIDGVVVQKMGADGIEMVLGARRDPVFGPVVMAGLGGVLVEVMGDVVFRSAPVSAAEADAMLDDLRGAALLAGVRGGEPADRGALVEMICALSELAALAHPRLAELDLNPVLVGRDGAVAVDWLMVVDGG
jgi:acetyltransferase